MGFSFSCSLDPAQPHCSDPKAARNKNKLILCTVLEKVRKILKDKSTFSKNTQILLINKIAPSALYTGIEIRIA